VAKRFRCAKSYNKEKGYLPTGIGYNMSFAFSPKGSRKESRSAKAWAFPFLKTCDPKLAQSQ
jgi:hypothetical protein